MGRRIIRVEDTDVVTGRARGRSNVLLPPFSFSGTPPAGSQSGRWPAHMSFKLMWIQVTARVAGTATFDLLTSNVSFAEDAPDYKLLTTVSLNNSNYALFNLTKTIEQFTVTREQWLSVKCIDNDTCEDIVINITARPMNQEAQEL